MVYRWQMFDSLVAHEEPRIERVWHDGNSPDACGLGVAWIDDHVVRLRHQHGSDSQQCGIAFPGPSIYARARDGDSSGPVFRKLRLVDRLPGHLIGHIQFDELMAGKCHRFTDLTLHKNLEYRGRRIRSAIEDLLPPCVPSRGRKHPPRPSSESCCEKRQTITLREHAVFDADQQFLDGECTRLRHGCLHRRAIN